MRPQEIAAELRCIRPTRRPVFIWGQPGIGKSSVVKQDIVDLNKRSMLDWRLALKQEVDLMGVPSVEKGLTTWNPPAELPRKPGTDIFIDEFPQASIPVKNAASSLILDRVLGGYRLPEDTWIIAAGNLETDRAGTSLMPTQIASRFIHLYMTVHTDDWLEHAHEKGFDSRVIAYVKWARDDLHSFDPRSNEKAFACPRAWEFMSDIVKQRDACGMKWGTESSLELAAGIVGKGIATKFVGFLRIMDRLVSIDQILLKPESAAIPQDPSITYALVYGLLNKSDRKSFPAIMTYVTRLATEWQFLFMREVVKKKEDLSKTKQFIEWASKHKDFI